MQPQIVTNGSKTAIKKPSRIAYLDVLRILASFFVVLIHVLRVFWQSREATNEQFVVVTMLDTVAYVAVPLFFMISGAVFLSPKLSQRANTTKLAFKYIVIYLGWVIFYAGFRALLIYLDQKSIGLDIPYDSQSVVLHYHLRFLPQLIILYFLVPYIRKVINHSSRSEIKNLLKILIFAMLAYTFTGVIYDLLNRQMLQGATLDLRATYYLVPLIAPFTSSFVAGIGYAVLGHYLHNFQLSPKTRIKLYVAAVVSYIIGVVFMFYTQSGNLVLDNSSVLILLMASAFFVFFKCNITQPKTVIASRALSFWAKQTLGIYLVHPILVDLLVGKFDWLASLNFIPRVLILAVIMYGFSFVLTAIFNTLKNRFHYRRAAKTPSP